MRDQLSSGPVSRPASGYQARVVGSTLGASQPVRRGFVSTQLQARTERNLHRTCPMQKILSACKITADESETRNADESETRTADESGVQ